MCLKGSDRRIGEPARVIREAIHKVAISLHLYHGGRRPSKSAHAAGLAFLFLYFATAAAVEQSFSTKEVIPTTFLRLFLSCLILIFFSSFSVCEHGQVVLHPVRQVFVYNDCRGVEILTACTDTPKVRETSMNNQKVAKLPTAHRIILLPVKQFLFVRPKYRNATGNAKIRLIRRVSNRGTTGTM